MVNSSPFSKQRRPFVGQGVSFPLQVTRQGSLALSAEDLNIRQSMVIILMTDLGERVYRPNFGCRLSELAFAPMNQDTLSLMRIWVQEALEQWEPRITVIKVLTIPRQEEGRVDLMIQYEIRANYTQQSMVFPFYLKSEEGQ
ncbi:GPW/gp25 family protein [Roseofilum reptotaenium CS-1145]|uniref:Baseplate protein n=1 Tax=Roseofilum reptotaenium AO1-A TaxID=1925591 RepID=A0A1L9QM36_9CYAN|nr:MULTISPECIES: GPW/gp25 family protein [Roseofilum]MBP0030693.1 GPW/gp25 family protein [Roseofilum sp. Guam]MDB9517268.1 GPW/gp25 family protein [Roseofilum reptotaenium CS-1145]OJJ20765.1 baseplate protein [Roseofilum reptotaenium AO1-A]